MSEYQYYEFVAIDRPLTPQQMAELRQRSTRASITPTSFVNEYHWGDLKGDPTDWMVRYFDAFVYFANWCSCRLALRVPLSGFDQDALDAYTGEYAFTSTASASHWILDWNLNESENYERFGREGGEGWMGRLAPLRDELLRGDLRPLYLGWLAGVTAGEVDDSALEPPLPAGLGQLSAPQTALAEFLEIDPDLLAAAASASPALSADKHAATDRTEWLESVSHDQAKAWLGWLLEGRGQEAERQVKTAFYAWQRQQQTHPHTAEPAHRQVAELERLATIAAQQRKEQAAAERARLAAERQQQRQAYLAILLADAQRQWNNASAHAERGTASAYDSATHTLTDLAEAYRLAGQHAEFDRRLEQFMLTHGRRRALAKRLVQAKLWHGG